MRMTVREVETLRAELEGLRRDLHKSRAEAAERELDKADAVVAGPGYFRVEELALATLVRSDGRKLIRMRHAMTADLYRPESALTASEYLAEAARWMEEE